MPVKIAKTLKKTMIFSVFSWFWEFRSIRSHYSTSYFAGVDNCLALRLSRLSRHGKISYYGE